MTVLRFEKKVIYGTELGNNGKFPAMRDLIESNISGDMTSAKDLYVGFGMFADPLPYTMQDQYDNEVKELTLETIVLENNFLKAVFVPSLGGKLWSLYDKVKQRDLLTNNTEFKPCNLAIRNAWLAGGIEYNIGRRGHDEETCSPRFTALLEDSDGTPVVRFYEFDRDRQLPFQIDFYLPENSAFLFCRPRIMNTTGVEQPMYWWSNLALPMFKGARLFVPAKSAYTMAYDGGNRYVSEIELPCGEGFDCTYPENFPDSRDHFYAIPADVRKFESVINPDGKGFLYASTDRLQGRKLFVWGQHQGSHHWQRKLLGDGVQDYIEIQGGVGKTQVGCIPMPANTVWEWIEAYGPIEVAPEKVFNSWNDGVDAVAEEAEKILPRAFLDSELERTGKTFALKAGRVISNGSGWGALEEMRSGKKLAAHLDFGTVGKEQEQWVELLTENSISVKEPTSYLVSDKWYDLLKKADKSWQTLLHMGLYHFHNYDIDTAEKFFTEAKTLADNSWTRFATANLLFRRGKRNEACDIFAELALANDADISLRQDCFKIMLENPSFAPKMLEIWHKLPDFCKKRSYFIFFHAFALAHSGRLDEAEALLTANGGLESPCICEGETSVTQLYVFIKKEQAKLRGEILEEKDIEVPFVLDLRVSPPRGV